MIMNKCSKCRGVSEQGAGEGIVAEERESNVQLTKTTK
jgi:hypothetical protein